MSHTILIIDDEPNVVSSVSRMLSIEGYETLRAGSAAEGLELFETRKVDLVLVDVKMPGMSGIELLAELTARDPELPVIMMSAHGSIETAVRATRLGARDFLEKPLSSDKVLLALSNALRLSELEKETARLRASVDSEQKIVGSGAAMARVLKLLTRVAPADARVLITGESGTGKELAARAIHRLSGRSRGPFVTLNCAAVPAELIESELFGHEKGAFTGATKGRTGRFEQAHRGTLFLDEVGDMPLPMQAKLLRVLETGDVERVGGTGARRVDVRVVAATNKDLARAVARGEFRDDLFHRLNVVPIHMPPLRDRMDDFHEVAAHLLETLSRAGGRKSLRLSDEALARLAARSWPGNIRELKNAIERLVIFAPDEVIRGEDVDLFLQPAAGGPMSPGQRGTLKEMTRDMERRLIETTLEQHDGNVTATARSLGLERSHLYKKMKELGVPRDGE